MRIWYVYIYIYLIGTRYIYIYLRNKLRWYPQQPQRFIFTNLSKACCEAKRWKHLSWVSVIKMAANPVEPDLALHESLSTKASPEPSPAPSPEPSLEPCWTWPGSASGFTPKPPRHSPEPFPEPCWSCPGCAPKPPRPSPEPSPEPAPEPSPEPCWTLTWLCTKASRTFSRTFGTFSGTSLNLTWRLHQCTPELFWAEDPISLRCWRKTNQQVSK